MGTGSKALSLLRTNGSLQLRAVVFRDAVARSADERAGTGWREIRNHLDAAGRHERHCVVCLPSKWALTLHTELPDLSEADVAGFLQSKLKPAFPCDAATLRVSTSRCQTPSQKKSATQVGISGSHLALLEQVLQAAKLKPISFSLGTTALQPPDTDANAGRVDAGHRREPGGFANHLRWRRGGVAGAGRRAGDPIRH